MELIIGGAYQGKLTYAVKKHNLSQADLCDLNHGFPSGEYRCYYHFERLTRAAAAEGISSAELVKAFLPHIKNSVVISREIGCGIVPTDRSERLYRELHGETIRLLAEAADSVTRIFSGLPEVLK